MSLLLHLFLSVWAIADQATPQATVWVRDPAAVRDFFPAQDYRMLDNETEQQEWRDAGYVPPLERDAIFHKLKLEERLRNMDDLDKDILVMDARFDSLAHMKKRYPMLSDLQLRQLQNEVQGANP